MKGDHAVMTAELSLLRPLARACRVGLATSLLAGALTSGCTGGLVMSPHRSREGELGVASAEGRPASVIERASTYEKQNAKSRDVYWYRVWRASAMISLGQPAEGEALLDQVLTEIAAPEITVAEPQRLRMFAYDEKARAALVRQDAPAALGFLDRALALALEVPPSGGSACDRDLVIAARYRQILDTAQMAGDAGRAARAEGEVAKRLGEWSVCLASRDYPAMQVLLALKGVVGAPPAPVAVAAAPVPAPAKPGAKPTPVAPSPPPVAPTPTAAPAPVVPPPAPKPAGPVVLSTGLRTANVRYAPVDPTPYKDPMESVLKLIERQYKGAQADALIRVDGGRRALRVRYATKRFEGVPSLLPLFKNMVVFFERTRDVEPKIDEVLVQVETAEGSVQVVAQRGDIFDLFVDKIDDAGFQARLVEIR
jgi:hypothetical protein